MIILFIIIMITVLTVTKIADHFHTPKTYVFTEGGYKGDVLHY